MKKLILFTVTILGIFSFIAATYLTTQNQNLLDQPTSQATISQETIASLTARGFEVAGQYLPVRSPRMLDSTNLPETAHLKMSLDIRKAKNLQITWLGAYETQKIAASQNNTILVEDFEGDFPGTNWQLSGDPTWDKSNYQKHSGQNSMFCAKGGTAGVTPPANYPNNMNAMMVFGPFDLSNASLAFVRFWFWLETEKDKDWLWYMASNDGINFSGFGLSGSTGTSSPAWEQTSLNLAEMPDLGSLIGQSSVWIAFGFTSDSTGAKRGAFLDDVEVQKATVGTGISGYLKGSLSPAGNPYIAFDHIGVAKGDTLLILPGCELRFDAGKEFVIEGLLNARGTEIDSLKFTSNKTIPKPGDWIGIGFYTGYKNTIIQFARIEFGGYSQQSKSGIFADGREIVIANNFILNNNGSGIKCGNLAPGQPIIRQNRISKNTNGISGTLADGLIEENMIFGNQIGIYSYLSSFTIKKNKINQNSGRGIDSDTSDPTTIFQNIIENNGSDGIRAGGSYLWMTSEVYIIGNQILNNGGNGIIIDGMAYSAKISTNLVKGNRKNGIDFSGMHQFYKDLTIKIINNTIVYNSIYGIYCGNIFLYNCQITNNIVAEHSKSGIFSGDTRAFNISYNDFFNNHPNFDLSVFDSLGIFTKTNIKGDACDKYFNISNDPQFVNPNANDFHLQNGSPCKDAGNHNEFFNDLDGTANDMGFYGGGLVHINFSDYNFYKVVVSKSRKADFVIENYRDQSITINSFQLSELSNFSLSWSSSLTIPSYSSKSITITYKPTNLGVHAALLTINSNNFYGTTSAKIPCCGEGINGTDINGDVSGIWKKSGNPYILSGNVQIRSGQKLTIEPGVEIRFDGWYRFSVSGQLEAIGTANDSIIFTRHRPTYFSQGEGLRFYTQGDTDRMAYCIIERMIKIYDPVHGLPGARFDLEAIYASGSSPIIFDNSRISDHSGPVFNIKDGTTAILRNCILTNNGGTAIEYFSRTTRGEVSKCIIKANKGLGICAGYADIIARNNIIEKNTDSGIYSYNGGTIYFFNNVIYNNTTSRSSGGGIYIDDNGRLIASNNIVWNNRASSGLSQIYKHSYGSATIRYCDVQGGYQGEGNINADPLLIDPSKSNYQLSPNSPCIDAGDPDTLFNDPEDPNRPGFALAPAQGTIRNDMGAFGGPGAAGELTHLGPLPFSLISPLNDDTLNTQTPTLIWQKTINPFPGDKVVYSLLIDKSQNFSSAKTYSNLSDTSYTLKENLAATSVYYWKVIASNSYDFKTVSKEVFRFTIGNIAPQPFSLISPFQEDTLETSKPIFKWHKAIDPNPCDRINYELQIDTTESFLTAINFADIADTTFELQVELVPYLTYFWRVIASDSLGLKTASKEVFQFSIGNLNPRPFSLLFPSNADTIFTTSSILEWEQAIDPNTSDSISYSLHYSLDTTFAEADTVKGIAKTNYKIKSLKDHQSYFWKVKAEDNQGASTFSNQVFQFYTFAAPLPFKLLSTASEDTVTTDTLSFSWHSAFDPNPADTIRYTLLCDSSRSFINPITVTGISDTSFTFTDSLVNNARYFWTVMAVDKDSFTTASSDTFSFLVRYRPTGVAGAEGSELPTEFALSQNYPNPFNPTTTINYQLPQAQEVKLAIYNLRGQRVATLVDRKEAAGYYSITWDGKDEHGKQIASGVYLYRIETEGFVKVRKLVLLR